MEHRSGTVAEREAPLRPPAGRRVKREERGHKALPERDARAATAQARFTAWLVLGLPLAGAILTELAAPGFAASLIANPLSASLAALAAALQVTALACIARLTRARRA